LTRAWPEAGGGDFFGVTIVVRIGLLVAAGDGLIGEIQFVLPAFFCFSSSTGC
jgi:hypothetical protein